jgi:hypothetical protein
MKRQALVLGLTAALYAFVLLPVGLMIWSWTDLSGSLQLINGVVLVAAFFAAWMLAPVVAGDDEPPPLLVVLLLFSAGYVLLFKVLATFGISFGYNSFSRFLHQLEGWAQLITMLVVSRFLKPRVMLFVGLTAFALQFKAIGVLAPVVMNFPKWVHVLVSLIVALFIARSFCVGEDSPADRASRPFFLWFFAAAGTFVLIAELTGMWLFGWKEKLVWISFLLSFVLLVEDVAPRDPEPKPAGLGADYGRLFLVFVAFFVVISTVFQMREVVDDWAPRTWGAAARHWFPILACAAITIGLMKLLNIGARLPAHPPGRKAMLWGAILFAVGILAGGSFFGGIDGEGRMEFLFVLAFLVVVLAPIATLAVILLGTGLLKMLFALEPRPRG